MFRLLVLIAIVTLGFGAAFSYSLYRLSRPSDINGDRVKHIIDDKCTSIISVYKNQHYGYEITAPFGWRLASFITSSTNRSVPVDSADFAYFTNLSCQKEMQLAETISPENPLSGGEPVTQAFQNGAVIILFTDVTEVNRDFLLSASKKPFHNSMIFPISNVRTEMLSSRLDAIRFEVRTSTGTPPSDTVFIPYDKKVLNSRGEPVLGFTVQAMMDTSSSEAAFVSLFKSFHYVL